MKSFQRKVILAATLITAPAVGYNMAAASPTSISSSASTAAGCIGNPSTLSQGQSIQNGDTTLVMQSDGNLVVYQGSSAVWASNTAGHDSGTNQCAAQFQTDGNFVVYNGSKPLWASNTVGRGGTALCLSMTAPYLEMTDPSQDILWASSYCFSANFWLTQNRFVQNGDVKI